MHDESSYDKIVPLNNESMINIGYCKTEDALPKSGEATTDLEENLIGTKSFVYEGSFLDDTFTLLISN